jgi:hypothetical protein
MISLSKWRILLPITCFCCLLNLTLAFAPSRISLSSSKSCFSTTTTTTSLNDNLLDRFTNPKIEDPFLPLTEAGLAQVVAPTLQIFWLVSLGSSYPSWAAPLYDPTFAAPRGSFLAPTLIHGAGLACCWVLGCLAVKGYEREVYEGSFGQVFASTAKAGAFACGVLILATQFDLYQEMGGFVQLGDSPETDLRIVQGLVEVINDVFFEAVTLLTWRMFRSTV